MIPLKILIVEDEILIAEHIKDYLISFGYSQIFMIHHKQLAREAIEHISPDLILLDMHLQFPQDGIEIAKYIDEKGNPPYIFITANSNMLLIQEAIKTKAAAYITKPLKKSDLFASMQIALKSNPKEEERFLFVKENNNTLKVALNDILYIESNGNYITIHTPKQKILTRNSLEWVEEQLPEHKFMRVHRSFIINTKCIQTIKSKSVLINNIEIPISRTNAAKVSEYLKKSFDFH